MSLIRCFECQKLISDKSKRCIHCGYPIRWHIIKSVFRKCFFKIKVLIKELTLKKIIRFMLRLIILYICILSVLGIYYNIENYFKEYETKAEYSYYDSFLKKREYKYLDKIGLCEVNNHYRIFDDISIDGVIKEIKKNEFKDSNTTITTIILKGNWRIKIMEEKEKYKNGIIYKNILKKLKKGDHISISFDRQNMKCYGEEFIIKEIVYIHLYK